MRPKNKYFLKVPLVIAVSGEGGEFTVLDAEWGH